MVRGVWLLAAASSAALAADAVPSRIPREFVPDGPLLAAGASRGTIGGATWRREQDDFIATPGVSAGLLLVREKDLQDVALAGSFSCAGPCDAGVLLRIQKTLDGGVKGYLVSFGKGRPQMSVIALDAQGKELSRTPMRTPQPFARFAPPAGGESGARPPAVPGIDRVGGQPQAALKVRVIPVGGTPATSAVPPATTEPPRTPPPPAALQPGAWNEVTVTLDANIVRAALNGAARGAGITDDEAQSFGSIAFYVGPGSSPVRFTGWSYKDIGNRVLPAEVVSPRFRMQRLDGYFYAWDTAVADINRDGKKDVAAGPYYYLGPDYVKRREIYLGTAYNPSNQFVPNMVTFASDFTGDGWPDVLATEIRQLVLYVNPRGGAHRWARHVIAPTVRSEGVVFQDLDGDRVPELVFTEAGGVVFAKPDLADPTKPWPIFRVSAPEQAMLHGLGVGDLNRDGRPDIVQANGWWEQPAGGAMSAPWRHHPVRFDGPGVGHDEGGGNMAVVDVNGDALPDVVTSLNAHGFGLAWFEQKRDAAGNISFVRHMIMDDYRAAKRGELVVSQLHAGVHPTDIDGDGVMDFVTGKKVWAHLESSLDPDPNGPAYLLWYRGVRDRAAAGGVRFVPEVIHNRSGVGSGFKVADLDQNGTADVVTSGVNGTFVFWGRRGNER